MPSVLLPLSALRTHRACDLDKRIADFTTHHGFAPDETSTLRQWAEVTPAVADLLWATRCLLPEAGRQLAVGVALRAARRLLPTFEAKYPNDPRPRVALELAEKWLTEPTNVSDGELRAAADDADDADAAYAVYAAAAAAGDAYAAAAAARAAAADAARAADAADAADAAAAAYVTYAAAAAAYAAAAYAFDAAADAARAAAADTDAAERAQQRADFLDILTKLESGHAT